jgi:hypothetical protein
LFRGVLSLCFCCVLGLAPVFGASYYLLNIGGTVMMQIQETMTLDKAIEALNSLLEAFAWRSGGGDGKIISESIRALEYLRSQKSVSAQLNELVDQIAKTGSVLPVLKAFELLQFERLILFLEDVQYFAPAVLGYEVRDIAERILAHLYEVRQILEPYYEAQEV